MRPSAGRSPGIGPAATPEITVVAATRLEAWAARRALPSGTRVLHSGISASRAPRLTGPVVVCGLAGSLTAALPPGSVVVPRSVASPAGSSIACDPQLQTAFVRAAQELGYEPSSAPLITLATMATGKERERWRERGFSSVDMESALIGASSGRLAVVRVVLDAPGQELSEEWMSPLSAIANVRRWPEAVSLLWHAPRYAMRAAAVVARGLRLLSA